MRLYLGEYTDWQSVQNTCYSLRGLPEPEDILAYRYSTGMKRFIVIKEDDNNYKTINAAGETSYRTHNEVLKVLNNSRAPDKQLRLEWLDKYIYKPSIKKYSEIDI